MAGFIILVILGFFLFLFIGAIKGFTASNEARALRKELVALHRKVTELEKRGLSKDQVAETKPETIASKPIEIKAPEQTVAPLEQLFPKSTGDEAPDKTRQEAAPTKETPEPEQSKPVTPDSPAPPAPHQAKPAPTRRPRPKPKPRPKSKWAQQFEGMNWETLIGTYIVPRLGALGITIAVFIALALLAQKMGPGFRVVIGYVVSAGLFGLGRFTETKQPAYARVVYGAGLAVAYFVTFATHYIPYARIFDSPLPALGGMAVIVGIWAGVAQRRKSPTIAMLTTALGHFTIGLTSVTVENPGIYSVFGILLLSAGSAFFLLRNRWYYVGAIGMLASYSNHFLLLANSEGTGAVSEFIIGMSVLSAYFLIFSLAELFAPEELRRSGIPNVVRSLFVTLNSGFFFLIGTLLMESYDFTEDRQHLFEYAFAAVLLAISALYYLRRKQDPMYNTYFAKSVTVATLGLAVHFDGHTLTVALAIETIALLFSSRRSGLVVTRLFAHLVGTLTFAHGMMTFLLMDYVPYAAEDFTITLLQSILPPIALLLAALVYQRIDWSTRMRLGFTMPNALRTPLWKLDLCPEPSDSAKDPHKPLEGLFFPYTYALAGGILWLSYTLRMIDILDRFNLYACIALALLGLAWLLRSKPFATVSILFTATTLIMTWHTMIDTEFSAVYIVGVLCTILIALATEPKWLPDHDSLTFHRNPIAPYLFYGLATWCIGLYLTHPFSDMNFLGALIVGCVILSALTTLLHTRALATCATAYLLAAHAGWLIETINIFGDTANQLTTAQNVIAILLIVTGIAGDRFHTLRKLPVVACIFLCVAFITSTRFADLHISDAWYGFTLALIAAVFLAYGTALRSRTAAVLALGGTVFAALTQLQWAYDSIREYALAPTVLGFGSVILLLITYERAAHLRFTETLGKNLAPVTGTCVAFAALLGVIMLERIPGLAAFYLTLSWSVLALGYFAIAIGTREKTYRYAGLAILTLAILRVIVIDTRELEALARVLAFGGLGAILLGIGFGYAKAFGQSHSEETLPKEDPDDAVSQSVPVQEMDATESGEE